MPKAWFIALWLCCWLVISGTVYAQQATPSSLTPIGTLEAGDFRALALTRDGHRLLVADAENRQVRIYDFNDPAQPSLLSSLDVSGAPILLAGGENYGLVAEITDDPNADTLEVIAPALPSPRAEFVAGRNFIDIAKNPRALTTSPDGQWGIAVGSSGYTLLRINGADDIESLTNSDALISAALSNTTAYLLRAQSLQAAPLNALEALQASQTLALDGIPSAVALNDSAAEGVVVVDGSRLVFFDPATLQHTREFTLGGQPITSIHYLSKDDGDFLLITREGASDITVLNAADPGNQSALTTSAALDKPVRAIATFPPFMIVTDGVTIRIFSV